MLEFDQIYLIWRKGQGSRRHSVGILKRSDDGKHTFKYLPEVADLIKTEGFTPYTEFPDVNKTYNGNVAEIFGQRLVKVERADSKAFFDFWEVDKERLGDKFYLLGKTQGLVATDQFEFLADYKLNIGTHFVTEIAGLSKMEPLYRGTIIIGDQLTFEREQDNQYDSNAVIVKKGTLKVGYLKKCHNHIFLKPGAEKLLLTVKAFEQNGVIKRIFIKVAY